MSDRSPETIEREVEAERTALAHSLEDRAHALAPEKVAASVMDRVQTHGAPMLDSVVQTARANPAALALTGIGVAWLLMGKTRRAVPAEDPYMAEPTLVPADEALLGFDERVAAADAQMSPQVPARRTRVTATAAQMRAALHSGLEKLPEPARKRIESARLAAISAQESVEKQARQAARTASSLPRQQPLAVGGIAAGVGALIGALLPGTETEDRLMGAKRDQLMRDAELAFRDEVAKAKADSQMALQKGLEAGRDTLQQRLS